MTTRSLHRVDVNTALNLRIATWWVDHSGILEILGDARRGTNTNRVGSPVKYGQYTTRGLMIALCEMALSGREMSFVELLHTLWVRYDDTILEALGMPDIRDAETLEVINLAARGDSTLEQLRTARRAQDRVEQRIREAFDKATAPINDNALPGGRRHTNAELEEARLNNPELAVKRAARERAMNALIYGSLCTANEIRYPHLDPHDLNAGILKDWYGDVAIDETEVDKAIATGRPLTGPNGLHPATELATFFKKSRRLEWPHLLGLTLGISVSRPGKRRVPTLALSASINDPSPGNLAAAMAVLDAIAARGFRPKAKSNRRQYVVADLAYPNLRGWTESLLDRSYSAVMKYRSTTPRVRPLTTPEDNGPAAHLFNGVPVCPGMSAKALDNMNLNAPKLRKNGDRLAYDGRELHEHDEKIDALKSVTMPRHGRPELTANRTAGRPRVGLPDNKDHVVKIRVMCPAAAGVSRCPLVPESMHADPGLPLVPDPPIDAPPSTCKQSYTTVRMTRLHFKDYQEHMCGQWYHEDLYTSGRARNEAFHAILINRVGGNLTRGNTKPFKNAFTTLAVAMAIGATNIKIMDRWDEVVSLNGGAPPLEPHGQKQRIRRNRLAAYRNAHTRQKD